MPKWFRRYQRQLNGHTYKYLLYAIVPYVAVGIGLYCLQNAAAALLLYHGQILVIAWLDRTDINKSLFFGFSPKALGASVLPLLTFGPLLYLLLPHVLREGVSLQGWLSVYGLSHRRFLLFMPYFGLVHPVMEEIHWGRFRGDPKGQWLMSLCFAGYHILVLAKLLTLFGLIISFGVLTLAAWAWTILYRRLRGGAVPFLAHMLADLGILGAAYVTAFC